MTGVKSLNVKLVAKKFNCPGLGAQYDFKVSGQNAEEIVIEFHNTIYLIQQEVCYINSQLAFCYADNDHRIVIKPADNQIKDYTISVMGVI